MKNVSTVILSLERKFLLLLQQLHVYSLKTGKCTTITGKLNTPEFNRLYETFYVFGKNVFLTCHLTSNLKGMKQFFEDQYNAHDSLQDVIALSRLVEKIGPSITVKSSFSFSLSSVVSIFKFQKRCKAPL